MCLPWQLNCEISNATDSAVQKFVQAMADGCKAALQYVSTFWMKVPSPVLALKGGSGWHGADALVSLQQSLLPVMAAVAVISFAVALVKIAMNPDRAREGMDGILRQILAVLLSTVPAMAASQLLITFGDLFSPWVIKKAAGMPASQGFQQIIIGHIFGDSTAGEIGNNAAGSPLGLFLVLFLLGIIGSVVQCFFMLFRGAALLVLFVILPAVGAGAATDEGWIRYKRLLAVILGFILYKPVAAIVYATGMKLMSSQANGNDTVQNAILGLTIITMAALALPAFIKFLLPAAAVGSSSAFSGAAGIGAVAAGAAVVGLSGGAAAPAAAAGAAATTSGGAATTAATAEGGAEAAAVTGGGAGAATAGGADSAGTAAAGAGDASGAAGGAGDAGGGAGDGVSGAGSAGGSSAAEGEGASSGSPSPSGDSASSSNDSSPSSGSGGSGSGGSESSGADSTGADSGALAADSGAESTSPTAGASGAADGGSQNVAAGATAPGSVNGTGNGSSRGARVVSEGVQQVANGAQRAGDDAAEGADQ